MHLYEKLRQPEFDKRRNNASLALYLETGRIDIARPFDPWLLPENPTWDEAPFKDDTWGLYYHSLGWLIILDYGIDHAPEPSQRTHCSDRLRRYLFSYLGFIVRTPEDECPKMMWFDHAAAWRASIMAYLVEKRFKSDLGETEERVLESAVKQHESKLLGFIDSGRWNANNHGLFHAEAIWDMATIFPAMTEGSPNIALAHMRKVFSEMIDFDEGVCREQSIYYHVFDAWLLAESAKYMSRFDVEVIPGYQAVLEKMVKFYLNFAGGGRELHAIGDTQYGRLTETGMLRQVANETREGLIEEHSQQSSPPLIEYPRNGYYFFNDIDQPASKKRSFAILVSKPYIGAHGHWDGGSFTIDYAGNPFIIDSGGPYAYGDPLRFNYYKAAEAHNVVVFGKKSHAYLMNVASVTRGANGNAIRLETADIPNSNWQRTFAAIGNGAFLVLDRIRTTARVCNVAMHLAPDISVESVGEHQFCLTSRNERIEVLYVSNASISSRVTSGDAGFPRSFVTPGLRSSLPSQVLSAEVSAKDSWVLTLIGGDSIRGAAVHSLYAGKLVRVMIPGEQPKAVDLNIEDASIPVRMYPYRSHRN